MGSADTAPAPGTGTPGYGRGGAGVGASSPGAAEVPPPDSGTGGLARPSRDRGFEWATPARKVGGLIRARPAALGAHQRGWRTRSSESLWETRGLCKVQACRRFSTWEPHLLWKLTWRSAERGGTARGSGDQGCVCSPSGGGLSGLVPTPSPHCR